MARKSAALLKSQPIKLPKRSVQLLAKLAQFSPPEKTEEHWQRYLDHQRELEEVWVRYDTLGKLVDKQGDNDPNWPAFIELGKEVEVKQRAAFQAYDGWKNTVRHRFDKIGAPEEDVRAIVNDSLTPNLDELDFSLNHGLLASHVTKTIRALTSEESAGEPPLCQECAA